MKLTKAFVVTMLATGSIIVCGSALAQDTPSAPAPVVTTNSPAGLPHTHHGSNMDALAQALNLTDAQKAQVQPIIAEQYKKMRALRNDTSLSVEDRKAKMKEVRNDTSTQLQSILTPAQFDKWQSRAHAHHNKQQAPDVGTNTPSGSANQ